MESFTFFLCIVIGHAFGDQQWAAMGKDDFKANEDAREGLSLYVKEANYDDQYLQSKDVQVPTQSGSSKEAETDEKPSSLGMGSHLTFGAYKVKKKGNKLHLGTRETRLRLKHSPQNTSAKKEDSTMFRSVPVRSAAIRYAGKNSSIKTANSSFRRNQLDAFKLDEPNNEKLQDFPKPQENQTGPVTIPHTGVAGTLAVSHNAMRSLLDKRPDVLKSKILITDEAKKAVLESHAKSQSVPTKSLHAHNSAKNSEGEFLKQLLTNVSIILPGYTSARKDITRNLTMLHDQFREFFHMPSTAMESYEALKKDELTSLESFLSDSGQREDSVNSEASRFEETRKMKRTKRAVSKKRRQDPMAGLFQAMEEAKKEVNKQRPANAGNRPKGHNGPDIPMTHGFHDPPVTCNVKVQLNQAQINTIVNAHNAARRREKASNMLKLTWDPLAAKVAQQKASACEWGHSMTSDCKGRPLGQNLFSNYASDEQLYRPFDLNKFTMMWADERKDWNFRTKTCAPDRMCGHWQTVTGAKIRTVGCGFSKCPKFKMENGIRSHVNHLVCNYSPAIPGPNFETGAPCSKCAKIAATTPERGWICENKLCVPCNPKKKKGCKKASMADDL